MKILGWKIKKSLSPVSSTGSWWPLVRESYSGAWQTNVEVSAETMLAFHAVYSCITLIAGDIAKLRFKLTAKQSFGTWKEIESSAYTPFLRKPNRYQTHIQFKENWIISKLSRGNTYVLKQTDGRDVVTNMFILDPNRVRPMVSEDGGVYYEIKKDNLAAIGETIIIPASEIIHDRMNCLFHPLVGIPPLYACGLATQHGLAIQNNASKFFGNNAMPAGILVAPGTITKENADILKTKWEENYKGDNYGKIAVLGDGLKFESMVMKSSDAQLIEQLKITAEIVCSTFHVPGYMVGVAAPPTYNNIEALYLSYYNQTLQTLIESMEACLGEGMKLSKNIGVELDLGGLLRMDTETRYRTKGQAIKDGWMSPNEVRMGEELDPVKGGETPYLQQQNYSLAALAERDENKPFKKTEQLPEIAPESVPANVPPKYLELKLHNMFLEEQQHASN